jgi:hypothetical protein
MPTPEHTQEIEKLTTPSNAVEVRRDRRGPRQHPGGYANAGQFHSNYGGPSPVAQAFNTMDKRPKAKFVINNCCGGDTSAFSSLELLCLPRVVEA